MENMLIRDIEEKDFKSILSLNEISVQVLSPLDEDKLRRLIQMASIHVVVEATNESNSNPESEPKNEIAAFLLVFSEDADYESVNYQWFNKQYSNFRYIDRVVVSDKYRGMGIASNLYRHTLKQMQISDAKILCAEIDVLPPNEPSLLFHQKFGFKELELLKHKENKVVSLQALKVN